MLPDKAITSAILNAVPERAGYSCPTKPNTTGKPAANPIPITIKLANKEPYEPEYHNRPLPTMVSSIENIRIVNDESFCNNPPSNNLAIVRPKRENDNANNASSFVALTLSPINVVVQLLTNDSTPL